MKGIARKCLPAWPVPVTGRVVFAAGQLGYGVDAAQGSDDFACVGKHGIMEYPKFLRVSSGGIIAVRRNLLRRYQRLMNERTETVADRCIRLRKAMGYDYHGGIKAFADHLGVSEDRWGNVERGLPLSKQLAFLVVQKCHGVTTEWLWFGGAGGLSLRMAQLLGEVPPTTRRATGRGAS